MISKSRTGAALIALGLLVASCGGSNDAGEQRRDSTYDVTVMTRNLYLGAELTPLFEATADNLTQAARTTYEQVTSSDVEARLGAIAGEIAEARPDLVALQEASLWRVQPPGSSEPQDVYDFVAILLERLERQGESYEVAATVDGFAGGLPIEGIGTVTMQDRDVILARDTPHLSVANAQHGTFEARLEVFVAGAPIEIVRGWASVDATIEGRTFRFVATHLEAFGATIRDAQQRELLGIVEASTLPTMLLGDLNSTPTGEDSQTYRDALAAGFSDVWSVVGEGEEGSTCCRAANLRGGSLHERIDYVLYRGAFDVLTADVVGTGDSSRTPTGRWASDHAGVVATLSVPD